MMDDIDSRTGEALPAADADKHSIREPTERPLAGNGSTPPAAPVRGTAAGARAAAPNQECGEDDSRMGLAACIPAVFWSADGGWPPGRVKPDGS